MKDLIQAIIDLPEDSPTDNKLSSYINSEQLNKLIGLMGSTMASINQAILINGVGASRDMHRDIFIELLPKDQNHLNELNKKLSIIEKANPQNEEDLMYENLLMTFQASMFKLQEAVFNASELNFPQIKDQIKAATKAIEKQEREEKRSLSELEIESKLTAFLPIKSNKDEAMTNIIGAAINQIMNAELYSNIVKDYYAPEASRQVRELKNACDTYLLELQTVIMQDIHKLSPSKPGYYNISDEFLKEVTIDFPKGISGEEKSLIYHSQLLHYAALNSPNKLNPEITSILQKHFFVEKLSKILENNHLAAVDKVSQFHTDLTNEPRLLSDISSSFKKFLHEIGKILNIPSLMIKTKKETEHFESAVHFSIFEQDKQPTTNAKKMDLKENSRPKRSQ